MPRLTLRRKGSKSSLTGTEELSDTDNDQIMRSSPHKCKPCRRRSLTVRTQEQSIAQPFKTRPSEQPVVSFSQVQIREYARRPCTNPGGNVGVPLTLEWSHQSEVTVDIETYENTRPQRRNRNELVIPERIRFDLMRETGYSRGEIQEYIRVANIARGQRSSTNATLQLAAAQEVAQNFVRGVLNKSVRRKSKKLEKENIQAHILKDKRLLELSLADEEEQVRRGHSALPKKDSESTESEDDLEDPVGQAHGTSFLSSNPLDDTRNTLQLSC